MAAKSLINKIKKFKFKKTPGLIFLAGVFLLTFTSFYQIKKAIYTSRQTPQSAGAPLSLTIPSLDLENVDIVEGGFENGHWLLADDALLWLPTSGQLEEGFNTIVYGHKKPGLFVNLYKLELADEIILTSKSGQVFHYQVTDKIQVKPDNLEALESDAANSLTLFTCDGAFDQNRLVIKARQN